MDTELGEGGEGLAVSHYTVSSRLHYSARVPAITLQIYIFNWTSV